jgi:hypothetical protein
VIDGCRQRQAEIRKAAIKQELLLLTADGQRGASVSRAA